MAAIYNASMPPETIQFDNSTIEDSYTADLTLKLKLFQEVEKSLELLKHECEGSDLTVNGSPIEFSDIDQMLKQDQLELMAAVKHISDLEKTVYKLFNLNRIWWELLLKCCIWERRIDSLLCANGAILNLNGWFWAPSAEVKSRNMKELEKFEPLRSCSSECLPKTSDFISEELKRVRIPFTNGEEDHIAAVFKDEISSIVACALALLKDYIFEVEVQDDNMAVQSEACFGSLSLPLWLFSGRSSGSESVPLIGTTKEDCLDGLSSLKTSVTSGTQHPYICLGGEKDRYTIRCPYARQFRDLRSRCCSSEVDFIASLNRCTKWDAKGGKSKSLFTKTLDGRLILKEIHRNEYNSFLNFANAYFDHMKKVNQENQSCLARILGIYQVFDGVKESSHDLIVMENLSYGRNFAQQYDLKGVNIKERYIKTKDASGNVLLDKNFAKNMARNPKFLSNAAKQALDKALDKDTAFLHKIKVMDYSLLVGVDDERQEFVCGIIDYLGPYTCFKCLETCCKYCYRVPTVIPPKQYSQRFFKFMTEHFLTISEEN